MNASLRFLLTLLTVLCCTTIAGASVQEGHAGAVFEKACVLEGESHFSVSFVAPRSLLGKADFDGLPRTGSIDPSRIRFSQDSIRGTFKDGGSVDDLVAGLRSGSIDPSSIPAVRIVERNGQIFTLDNRRLHAFQQAGVEIPSKNGVSQEWHGIKPYIVEFQRRKAGRGAMVAV